MSNYHCDVKNVLVTLNKIRELFFKSDEYSMELIVPIDTDYITDNT